jgi:hypothetical protein
MASSLVPSKPAHQWPTDGTVRPRSWHAELPKAKRERVKDGRFLVRFLVLFAFCLGVVATLAWQSYGDAARQMIANTSPRLSWFAPSPASVGEVLPELGLRMAPVGEAILAAPSSDQEQLKTLSAGLADVRQRIDQMAAQLPAVQEQMTRDISNKLEAVEHEIFEKVSAPLPRPPAAQPRKLSP